jgi:serine/threonine protein phosphatase PrpC
VICGQLGGVTDRDFFAVYDGHGSRAEADFAAWYVHRCVVHELDGLATVNLRDATVLSILECVFAQTSDAMRARGYGVQSGTTAVVCRGTGRAPLSTAVPPAMHS